MPTKKCPLCAEEIQQEAVLCRFCGARFDPGPPEANLPPPGWEKGAAFRAPTAAAPAMPAMPRGELREGIVPSARQLAGHALVVIVVFGTLVAASLGWGAGAPLTWGRSASAWLGSPPAFFLGPLVIVVVLGALVIRRLTPRVGTAGLPQAGRRFRESLRARYGVSQLYRRQGRTAGIVVTLFLWLTLEGVAVYNYRILLDEGWTVKPGMYLALVLPIAGAIGTLLLLGNGRQVVRLDSGGAFFD